MASLSFDLEDAAEGAVLAVGRRAGSASFVSGYRKDVVGAREAGVSGISKSSLKCWISLGG